METITKIADMKKYSNQYLADGKIIALIPTMGYLHEGHLSLVRKAKEQCDIVVLSIYVNPTQFAPEEDLEAYPRDIGNDIKLCRKAGINAIFYPNDEMMYPKGYQTYIDVQKITKLLCGKSRPTHFRGVTTIVNKLFNIIRPAIAYFGRKDYQQVLVIKRMVEDLNINTKIEVCPIIREEDGLAMSSRNRYLTEKERRDALILNQILKEAKKSFNKGIYRVCDLKKQVIQGISSKPSAKIDYVEIYDKKNLTENEYAQKGNTFIALAVKFGKARLLDNIEL